jgi:RNA polymerase sigma-70 factor (ECF subfamily)
MALRQAHQIEPDFDRFVRTNARPLLAYCLRRATPADADEAAAQALTIAWQKWDEVPDGDQALYWLFGVARRVLSNQRRGQRRRLRLSRRARSIAAAADPGVDTLVVRHERDQEVIDAVASLSEPDREILALLVWEEVPRSEVADLLGISRHAVHKRYQRALHRLSRMLDEGDSPEEGAAP